MAFREYPDPVHPGGQLGRPYDGQQVILLHPGLSSPNTLLRFPALDRATDGTSGVDYLLVHTACSIVACNRFDGVFEDLDGGVVSGGASGVLPAGKYNFVVPSKHGRPEELWPGTLMLTRSEDCSEPYPVVPSLTHYEFRDTDVPMQWRSLSNVRSPITEPDKSSPQLIVCRMTRFTRCIEEAHIIPKIEPSWFNTNEMSNYAPETVDAFGSATNKLGLRSDVHTMWDNHDFVFVPKRSPGSDHFSLVAHSFVTSAEVLELYHDTRLQDLYHVPYQYLYARFAMAILRRVPKFMEHCAPVPISVRDSGGAFQRKVLDWQEVIQLMESDGRNPSTGRTFTSRKRSASKQNHEDQDSDQAGPDDDSHDDGDSDDASHDFVRSLKRRRILGPTSGDTGPYFELIPSTNGSYICKDLPDDFLLDKIQQASRGRTRVRA
ncbi:hypothetical protein ANO11243_067410 [Dothideomycetidae sp. 11243]|nr:hypothetical protein ANO11243_067410 [fungal sp. No.11243]